MMMFLLRNAECFAPQPLGRADVLVAGDKIAWLGIELPATTLTGSVRGDITHIDVIIGVGDGEEHV